MKGFLCFIKPAQYNISSVWFMVFCVWIPLEAHIAGDEIVPAVRQLQHWKTGHQTHHLLCLVLFRGLWYIVCKPIHIFRKLTILRLYGPDSEYNTNSLIRFCSMLYYFVDGKEYEEGFMELCGNHIGMQKTCKNIWVSAQTPDLELFVGGRMKGTQSLSSSSCCPC